jgi:hypothetical protein
MWTSLTILLLWLSIVVNSNDDPTISPTQSAAPTVAPTIATPLVAQQNPYATGMNEAGIVIAVMIGLSVIMLFFICRNNLPNSANKSPALPKDKKYPALLNDVNEERSISEWNRISKENLAEPITKIGSTHQNSNQ